MKPPGRLYITSHHAVVRELLPKEKLGLSAKAPKKGKTALVRKRIVERRSKELPEYKIKRTYSVAMTLANLLFPRFFPKQIASSTLKTERGHPHSNYFLKIPLDRQTLDALSDHYSERPKLWPLDRFPEFRDRSEEMLKAVRKMADCGILVQDSPANVGFDQKGRIHFFEVRAMNLNVLKKYVGYLPQRGAGQRLLKKQAGELILALEKDAIGGYVETHHDYIVTQ